MKSLLAKNIIITAVIIAVPLALAAQDAPQRQSALASGNVSLVIQDRLVAFADSAEIAETRQPASQTFNLSGRVMLCSPDIVATADSMQISNKGENVVLQGRVVYDWKGYGTVYAERTEYSTVTGNVEMTAAPESVVELRLKSDAEPPPPPGTTKLSKEELKNFCREVYESPPPAQKSVKPDAATDNVKARKLTLLSNDREVIFQDDVKADLESRVFKLSAKYVRMLFDKDGQLGSLAAKENVAFEDTAGKGRAEAMAYDAKKKEMKLDGNVAVETAEGLIEARSMTLGRQPNGSPQVRAPKNQHFKITQ